MDRFLTISEVAERLSLTAQTIYKMIKDGILPAIRVGSQWRLSEDKISQWLKAQEASHVNTVGNQDTDPNRQTVSKPSKE